MIALAMMVDVWRSCRMVLCNPYYHSGSVIAKLATNWSSAVWAIIVLGKKDALATTYYAQLGRLVPEDAIAWPMLLGSIVQTIWLMRRWRPLPYGAFGYALQAFFWITLLAFIGLNEGPAQPTAIATVSTVAVLAAIAFATIPRKVYDDGIAD